MDLNMSNNSANSTDLSVTFIAGVPLGILGSILNSILALIIVSSRKLKNPSYTFIANLAISDMFMAVQVTINHYIGFLLSELPTSICNLLCISRYVALVVCYITSVFSLTAVNLYRLEIILEPLRHRSIKFAFRRPKITNLIIWLTSIVLGIPLFLIVRYNKQARVCDITFLFGQAFNITYFGILLFLTYFLPLAIMVLTYRRIGIKLRATGNFTITSRYTDNQAKKIPNVRSRMAIKFLCIATAIYMLLSWPLLAAVEVMSISGFTYSFIYESFGTVNMLFVIAVSLTFIVSIINPILFLTFDNNVKSEIQGYSQCVIISTPSDGSTCCHTVH